MTRRPPGNIDGARVVYFAAVDEDVRATGATRHSLGTIVDGELVPGSPMEPFRALAIVQHEGDDDYYLLYLDAEWKQVTDTWHRTVKDAKQQAELEYEGISTKWMSPE